MISPLFVIDQTDNRNAFLATFLSQEGYNVCFCYSDSSNSPLPFNKPYALVLSPAKTVTESIASSVPPNSYIFGGACTSEALEIMEKKEILHVNFLEDEHFTMLNAIPTAEGALMIVMQNTVSTIKDMEVLLLGYGRVAKSVNHIFTALGAKVTILARNIKDIASASIFAHAAYNFEYLHKNTITADVIINTVPQKILTRTELIRLNPEIFILDLASKPGGVDFEVAKELGLKTEHALSLPGKVAPKAAGEYMKRTILRTLALIERNEMNE
ncbi:MAG: spoVFA [Clostridiales bacterium]|jgi:dipicolinate synthase subunit A|nr:spoVFA [Clostridiales bacterium]